MSDQSKFEEAALRWIMTVSSGSVQFNWPVIKEIAALPIPAPRPQADGGSSMLSLEWREHESAFRNIQLCRNLLAARHEGWVAADPNTPDPIQPEPMTRPDDFCV